MTEAELQSAVVGIVRQVGCEWVHLPTSRRSKRHWPDLTIACWDGRTLYRELKLTTGALAVGQHEVIERLRQLGHDAGIWTERDLAEGTIERELLGGRDPGTLVCHPASLRAGMLVGDDRARRERFLALRADGYGEAAAQRIMAAEDRGRDGAPGGLGDEAARFWSNGAEMAAAASRDDSDANRQRRARGRR